MAGHNVEEAPLTPDHPAPLVFPQDKCMGELVFTRSTGEFGPRQSVPAIGTIQPPAGSSVKLVIGEGSALDLSPLARLQPDALKSLNLEWLPIISAQLAHIQHLTGLEQVCASRTRVRDAGMHYLARLTGLRSLDLSLTQVTHRGLAVVGALRSLRSLNLERVRVGDAGMKHLAGLEHLEELNLSQTGVTDVGVTELRSCRRLTDLDLSCNPGITDAVIHSLECLPNLQDLTLGGTNVRGHVLGRLGTGGKLRFLILVSTPTDDLALTEIAQLETIDQLWLSFTAITDVGLPQLESLPKLDELRLWGTAVSDAGLESLEPLTGLRELWLGETSCTASGISRLKAALPGCNVVTEPIEYIVQERE